MESASDPRRKLWERMVAAASESKATDPASPGLQGPCLAQLAKVTILLDIRTREYLAHGDSPTRAFTGAYDEIDGLLEKYDVDLRALGAAEPLRQFFLDCIQQWGLVEPETSLEPGPRPRW